MDRKTPRTTIAEEEKLIKRAAPDFRKIDWKKGELISAGKNGSVFSALDVDEGKIIAVKTVPLLLSEDLLLERITSLRREAAALRDLRHPNIIRYLSVDVSADK